MKKISTITGRVYDPHDIVNILNLDQVKFYIEDMGIPLQDIKFSTSKKMGKTIVVFLFLKKDTTIAFDRWVRRRDENKNGFNGHLNQT